MPILSTAFKLTCTSCGWKKLLPPMSDVRFLGQVPEKCPTCGNEQLTHLKPNMAEKLLFSIRPKL